MLTKQDILNAPEIYLSKNNDLFLLTDDSENAYHFSKDTLVWKKLKRDYSWKVWNEAISGKKANELIKIWKKGKNDEQYSLNKAIIFATEKHSGQFRKSTKLPYILHPIEVLQILYSMRADTNLMISGVLHDTIEDTDTTLDEIKKLFGDDVAMLVSSNSEDKSKSWEERKQHTINELAKADTRVKMLIMADKLANIRSIAYDYKHIGDKLWERFNAPKEKQAWYYDGIADALYDMQFIPECKSAYWEFTRLFKDVFVKFYFDENEETLYQSCTSETIFCFKRIKLQWENYIDTLASDISGILHPSLSPDREFFSVRIPDSAKEISREHAELLEDFWTRKLK